MRQAAGFWLRLVIALWATARLAPASATPRPDDTVWIAPGWFTYGSRDVDLEAARRLCVRERVALGLALRGCGGDTLLERELPARRVFLPGYALDRYEVSRAEHLRCVDAGVCDPPSFVTHHPALTRPEHPMIGLSFAGARALCRFRGGRLPSEAEWERGARGDSARQFPWGHVYNEALANHGLAALAFEPLAGAPSARDGFRYLAPVTAFGDAKSPHGLVQMAGNVWEWTEDPFAGIRALPLHVDPRVQIDNGQRSVRGGSYRSPAFALRVTHREPRAERRGFPDVGVRCAYDPLRSGSVRPSPP